MSRIRQYEQWIRSSWAIALVLLSIGHYMFEPMQPDTPQNDHIDSLPELIAETLLGMESYDVGENETENPQGKKVNSSSDEIFMVGHDLELWKGSGFSTNIPTPTAYQQLHSQTFLNEPTPPPEA